MRESERGREREGPYRGRRGDAVRGERGREYRGTAAGERARARERERETERPRSYRPLHGTNAMYAATDRPSCDPSVYNRAAALRAPDTAYIAYHATAACRYIHLRYIPLSRSGLEAYGTGGIYVRYTAPRRPSRAYVRVRGRENVHSRA